MSDGMHYTYRVEWSPEDGEHVGLVAEFPSLSHLDPDPVEAFRGIRELVESVVVDMRESGEVPPTPLGERRYSGKVFVRTSPELHRRLTIEAAEQGVSVNQWAVQKLAERSGAPQYHTALGSLWAGTMRPSSPEDLDQNLVGTLLQYVTAVQGILRHGDHAGDEHLEVPWSKFMDLYVKPACRQCAAERAGRADDGDLEESGQLACTDR